MHSAKLKKPIVELSFKERSLLFAELSMIAYLKEDKAHKQARLLGFTTVEYYDKAGAQSYRFMNKHDIVIALVFFQNFNLLLKLCLMNW